MTPELGWDAWVTVGTLLLMFVALVKDLARPDLILLGSLGVLLGFGILTPEAAFSGFSNKAVLAVGALFVVAAGVQHTGALEFTDRLLFPRTPNLPVATARIMVTTATLSAFLNNTPIVAMFIPRVQAWCERTGVPVSKLMIPLSYSAILGGLTTLIGTSTNLLVAGLMEASGYAPLQLFDFAWVGGPAAVVAILYLAVVGHRLLPDRSKDGLSFDDDLKECLFEVRVATDAPLVGQTVEEAELRHLGDAFLVHVRRGADDIIPAAPEVALRGGDVLTFVGRASMLDHLLERPGLVREHPGLTEPAHATTRRAMSA